jgi:hypothetical protein
VYKVAVACIVDGWAVSEGIAQVFTAFDVLNRMIRLIERAHHRFLIALVLS